GVQLRVASISPKRRTPQRRWQVPLERQAKRTERRRERHTGTPVGLVAIRFLSAYAMELGRRPAIMLAMPTTITASGIGHHQCSQNAAIPWLLSRPAQKMPSSTNAAPSHRPRRFIATA